MTDTHVLLGKITALRQRLEQAQVLARQAGSAAAELTEQTRDASGRVWRLEHQASAGQEHAALLDGALRQIAEVTRTAGEPERLPQQLTSRARRLLERARDLLGQLRALADPLEGLRARNQSSPDPLTILYREATAMTETVLRFVQAFPDAASTQLRLCEGVEAILSVAGQRLATLQYLSAERRREQEQLDTLADLLPRLASGQPVEVQAFITLADAILAEVEQKPLVFPVTPVHDAARFIAAHSLTVAQVMARIVRADPELRTRAMEPVLAALVHDVGMLRIPADVWQHPGSLDDEKRRVIERHTQFGAELAARLLPSGAWLAEAAGSHHERLDGTGYPGGWRGPHIAQLTRLLAVCDVYVALAAPRPHREARETRTALADTLLLADQGALDPREAERLLLLSFYPAGSLVEMADGTVGLVVATHMAPRDLNTPARPVVAVLQDAHGRPLPAPHFLDLALCEGHGIVRSLNAVERRELLGRHHPEWT
jgi:HD-GYP domain-containing protein (c-di-GMP phosphodiesterase class II)